MRRQLVIVHGCHVCKDGVAEQSGSQVTTEGDAFQIAFHDTADAVAFCLDTQAELLRCDWPNATLAHPDAAAPDSVCRERERERERKTERERDEAKFLHRRSV